MMYRGPTFDIDQMHSTMRHLFLDVLSRSGGAVGDIAGCVIVITVATSTCHNCGNNGALPTELQGQEGEQHQQIY